MNMQIEKAIEIINRKTSIPEQGESFDDIVEAFDMAAEVLKRQIPKKMDASSFLGPRKGDNYTDYYCPSCKSKIVSVVNGDLVGGQKSAFCPDCGRALDWGPSEELKQLLDTL